jgi:hypothetical protein
MLRKPKGFSPCSLPFGCKAREREGREPFFKGQLYFFIFLYVKGE